MAPPAGTSSMLRSRRRDATLKPNRTLDRSASRGMLYENEELRLRTININAEVEKGQNYIKKLRRENEQLKREIWNLREEYERLENYVKSREQSEEEDEGGGGGVGGEDDDEETIPTQSTATAAVSESMPSTATVLETVIEEDDALPADDPRRQELDETTIEDDRGGIVVSPQTAVNIDGDNRNAHDCGDNGDVAAAASTATVAAGREHGAAAVPVALTADVLAADSGRPGGDRLDDDGDCVGEHQQQQQQQHHHHHHHHHQQQQQQQQQHRLEVYDYNCAAAGGGDGDHGQQPRGPLPHPDEAVLQPHTACFDTGSNRQLHDLTVDEVVNAIQDAELRDKLRTVSLTDDRCYMTFANAECLERALHTAVLRIRDVSVLLMDTGAGAIILSLTGVPDTVADKDVLKCLKRYGTIIGGVERKTSRGGTTGGERYVRIRPTLGAPRYLWFGSNKVVIRQLTEHETDTMNSVARRKSFRSQIKLNLKMADAHRAASVVVATAAGSSSSTGEARENCSGDSGGCGGSGGVFGAGSGGDDVRNCGVAVGSTATTTVSVQNGFRFPSQDTKTSTGGGGAPAAESCRTAPVVTANGTGKQQHQSTAGGGSIKKSKPTGPTTDGCAIASASSGPAESSPLRGRRRPSLMGFRRDTVKYRGGSVSRADGGGGGGGEDADSDTSPICRRKLSIKGHERTEKVPWCGCWGNGCL